MCLFPVSAFSSCLVALFQSNFYSIPILCAIPYTRALFVVCIPATFKCVYVWTFFASISVLFGKLFIFLLTAEVFSPKPDSVKSALGFFRFLRSFRPRSVSCIRWPNISVFLLERKRMIHLDDRKPQNRLNGQINEICLAVPIVRHSFQC